MHGFRSSLRAQEVRTVRVNELLYSVAMPLYMQSIQIGSITVAEVIYAKRPR